MLRRRGRSRTGTGKRLTLEQRVAALEQRAALPPPGPIVRGRNWFQIRVIYITWKGETEEFYPDAMWNSSITRCLSSGFGSIAKRLRSFNDYDIRSVRMIMYDQTGTTLFHYGPVEFPKEGKVH